MDGRYNALKAILMKRNIKQSEIADAIGMDRSTFNIKINRYDGRDFTLNEAVNISRYLDVPIDNFFED